MAGYHELFATNDRSGGVVTDRYMNHGELVALWHFDETGGLFAANSIVGGEPLMIHGAVFEPRRFGGALVLRRPLDYARGPAPPTMRAGTIACWLRLDAKPRAADILALHGTLSILVDGTAGTGLVAQIGEHTLPSGKQLTPGQWHHVALAFNPDGATLYLDGQSVSHEPKAKQGLVRGLNRDEYLAVGSLGEQFTPFAIDELVIFNTCLRDQRIRQLAMGDLEQVKPVRSQPQPRSIQARDYIDHADPTCGLQRAIDATGYAGGVVSIPAGRYVLHRPLVLASRVSLVGDGGQTVLASHAALASRLAAHCAEGADAVRVEDTSVFSPGDAVVIRSDNKLNFNATHAHVVRVEGNSVVLSRPLSHDYMTFDMSIVVTWFPLITAIRQHCIELRDLVLEGVPQTIEDVSEPVASPCAAVFLLDCVDAGITRCRVSCWAHDGIGIHGGARLRITESRVNDCLGHGLKLDGEARLIQVNANAAERNRMDGLNVGEEIRDALITGNLLNGNGGFGIGGLDRGNDKTNLVTANHCLHNRRGGIEHKAPVPGKSETVVNNLCSEPTTPKRITRRMF